MEDREEKREETDKEERVAAVLRQWAEVTTVAEAHISESIMQSSSPLAGRDAKVLVEEAQSELLSAQQSVRPMSQDFSMTIKKKYFQN